jgi:hypothetical protein
MARWDAAIAAGKRGPVPLADVGTQLAWAFARQSGQRTPAVVLGHDYRDRRRLIDPMARRPRPPLGPPRRDLTASAVRRPMMDELMARRRRAMKPAKYPPIPSCPPGEQSRVPSRRPDSSGGATPRSFSDSACLGRRFFRLPGRPLPREDYTR